MQLRRRHSFPAALVGAALLLGAPAHADVGLDATTTVFHEAGTPLEMTVITPSVDLSGDAGDWLTVRAGYEADIVSGASVAVVDAPTAQVDAITSATTLEDKRHTTSGSIELRGERTSLEAGFAHGRESDYRSNALTIAAAAELFERNTRFELSYARAWDGVCALRQPFAQEAVDRQRMPTADGCFEGADEGRETKDLDLQTFQGAWTQAWTPILVTQLTLTAQLLHGHQGNPYRAVWLGRTAAEEHHPVDRTRYAGGLRVRLWLEPLRGALHASGRLYRDTWDVESVTANLAYEQNITAGVRLRVRGRYYTQAGAFFYSDDYVRFPKGQYFTGDRELSPMTSWTVGGQVHWTVPPGEDGEVLGFIGSLDVVVKGDFIIYDFVDFHYGTVGVPNDTAYVLTAGLDMAF